jgi:hypothetical protein
MHERQEILDGLKPLFERAEREKLWFYSPYQDLWFSPEELREAQSEGRFIWGELNWHLRSPYERINQLEQQRRSLNEQMEKIFSRISN